MRIEISSTSPPADDGPPRLPRWAGAAAAIWIAATAEAAMAWAGVPLVLIVGCLAVFLALALGSGAAWRRARRSVRKGASARHWVITDDEIRVAGVGSVRTWRWPVVVAVDQRRDAYLLRQAAGIALDIPRHALTTGQDGELRAFLAGRGLLGR